LVSNYSKIHFVQIAKLTGLPPQILKKIEEQQQKLTITPPKIQNSQDGSLYLDLTNALETGVGADVTLLVGESEERMKLHKCILAVRSPFFAGMFGNSKVSLHFSSGLMP
jgi:hypothetical protein